MGRVVIVCVAAAVALALGVWSAVIEPDLLTVRRISVNSGPWPDGLGPLRIAVISDLHVGSPHVDLDKVDAVVDTVNGLGADVVALLGDYVILGMPFGRFVPPAPTAERLARLQAPLGVISVLGNHDNLRGAKQTREALEEAGIVVLEDDVMPLQAPGGRFWIVGLADEMTRGADAVGTVSRVPLAEPFIVLSHDPAVFFRVPDRAALIVAGHTHGGQVYLPLFGALVTPGRSPLRHAYGLVEEAGRHMVVSGGIGTSILPLRFNMPPEVVLITLR